MQSLTSSTPLPGRMIGFGLPFKAAASSGVNVGSPYLFFLLVWKNSFTLMQQSSTQRSCIPIYHLQRVGKRHFYRQIIKTCRYIIVVSYCYTLLCALQKLQYLHQRNARKAQCVCALRCISAQHYSNLLCFLKVIGNPFNGLYSGNLLLIVCDRAC